MDYLKRIREIKEERGLTNEEIAELADLPTTTVARILSGATQDPRFESVAKIAIALDGSLDRILGLVEEKDEQAPSCVESVMTSYAELLKEKNKLIDEKDSRIKALQEDKKRNNRTIAKLMIFIGVFVAVILFILLYDMLNGHMGYIRY